MDQISEKELNEINFYRAHLPYRKIYLLTKDGQSEVLCPKDRRPVNKMMREGWTAQEVLR